MSQNRRLLFKAIPVAAVAGGLATTLLFGPMTNRSVTAQDTAALTAAQMSVATSLEGAFMRIAETVGPATVSITASETLPARTSTRTVPPAESGKRPRGVTPRLVPPDGDSENNSDEYVNPFDELFGPQNNPFRRMPGGLPRTQTASGSGVIVRPDGWILTNDHIVEATNTATVTVKLADGTVYKGKVYRDFMSDLSVVKINPEKPLPFVKLADSSKVRVGQWAVAIGSPFGQQNTVTTGIVSAVQRKRTIVDGGEPRLYSNLIQTDASINPGNSGGPLLNINGELIGINVAIYSPTGTSLGIGYAIPSNTAKSIMEQLIATGKVTRSSLGVVPTDVPAGLRKRLGTATGAYIEEVSPDTPADRAGIQVEDVVIGFNGRPVNNEGDLREAIALTPPKTRVNLTVIRSGARQNVSAVLEPRTDGAVPATGKETAPQASPMANFGFEVAPLTRELTAESQIPAGTRGLMVQSVTPGSLAMQEGLTEGSVIVGVNGKPLTTTAELTQVLSAARSGDTVTLLVLLARPQQKLTRAAINITVP